MTFYQIAVNLKQNLNTGLQFFLDAYRTDIYFDVLFQGVANRRASSRAGCNVPGSRPTGTGSLPAETNFRIIGGLPSPAIST